MSRIIVFLTALCTAFNSGAQGFLKADGPFIVDEQGKHVILRGMGLGGWMLQEGYMFGLGNIGQQHRIRAKIEEVVGPERTQTFYNDWLAWHTTRTDIDSLASWGFNSIRLPMHYNLFTLPVDQEPIAGGNTWLDKGFMMVDSLVAWCKANKMYVILDMHATPGGQGNDLPISDRDPAKPSLWQSKADRDKLVALWQKLAARYANEPAIGGYDIINEPNWGFQDSTDTRGIREKDNGPLKQLMMDITKAIRSVDRRHIIIIEGNGFGNNYNGLLPAWDKNMVLSFHKYGNFNNEDAIRGFLHLREQYNVPLWMGESGENSNTWFTEAIRLVEDHEIGWAWWQSKKMGINNPLEVRVPVGYQALLDYWSGKGAKPAPDAAWRTLQQWLDNMRIENNIYHKDVIDAMFRQVRDTTTRPFIIHTINSGAVIRAVDFDLGRQGMAYMDRDTASYQYTPGVHTTGNRGRAYRNDGVDIRKDDGGYYVFSIEDGEWLQYTISVPRAGQYGVVLQTASDTDSGQLSLWCDGVETLPRIVLPKTGGPQRWQSAQSVTIKLDAGIHRLRVRADRGGFNFSGMQFTSTN